MLAGQLALAWLLAKGKQLGITVVPIPGTKREKYLIDNMGALQVRRSLYCSHTAAASLVVQHPSADPHTSLFSWFLLTRTPHVCCGSCKTACCKQPLNQILLSFALFALPHRSP